jgi:signal transduction histidine kinase/CheY-like chemotaxis protein
MSTQSSAKVTVEEEIQRLRTRIAELEHEKQVADGLQQPGEQYQILFNTLIEGFCIIEVVFDAEARPVDLRFLEVNPAFEQQTGLKNARGRLVRELISDLEAYWFEIYGHVALTGQPARFVNEAKPLNRWYSVSAYRVGRPESRRIAVLFNDITEIKRAEQRLRDTQKLETLGVLASGIAHDFNNMLGGILAQSELTLAEVSAGSAVAEGISTIRGVALHAAETVRQLLAYAGQENSTFELVDLSRLVGEMLPLLTVSISKHSVLKTELAENLPAVRANVPQLRRILMNLVTNASEALAEGSGVITVATAWVDSAKSGTDLCDSDYVRLEVSDTGCGMSEEIQARMFDPFFTTKFAGRGLGLATVQGLVRNLGGTIKVVSEPGQGTCVRVLLPSSGELGPDDHHVPASYGADADDAISGTVLFVEDEETIRTPNVELLRRKGLSVLEANDGLTAVDLFRANNSRIAVVLLDLTLPGIDGKNVFAEVRRMRPDIKVILTTAYSEEMAMSAVGGQHDWAFIRKPYTITELAKITSRRAIGLRQLQSQILEFRFIADHK